jgi:hypothetical protein
VAANPHVVAAPAEGLWRVARGANPLGTPPRNRGDAGGGNRFDPLSARVDVLYFGTDLDACFGETLARLRPNLNLVAVIQNEWRERGFMEPGSVAADWRQRRSAVHVGVPEGAGFLDVEAPETHQFLRGELALGLSALGLHDLDVSTVRGPDRRVTRLIADWAYLANDGERPLYAGIRYESRVRSGWECWALFDDEELSLEVIETLPITLDMPALRRIADLFDLQMF